jgi:hypothetical protein
MRPARNHATRRTSLLYTHTSHNQKTNPLIDRCVPHRNQHIQVIKLCQLLFLYCQFVKRIFISITLYRRVPRRHGQTHSLSAPSRGGRVYPSVRHTHRIVMLMQDTTEPSLLDTSVTLTSLTNPTQVNQVGDDIFCHHRIG